MKTFTNFIPSSKFILAALILLIINFPVWADGGGYKLTKLVADLPGIAAHVDINLKNPWGIAFNPNGFVWVANNGTGTSTLYDGNGLVSANLPVVNVPGEGGVPGNPTGIVFNSSRDFNVTPNNPAAFIFVNEGGSLAAWSPSVDLLNAKVVGGTIPDKDPIYKGLALAGNGVDHYLYVTDFHNAKVHVFDKDFNWVTPKTKLTCDFSDRHIPSGYAPFGIQNINGALYVTYAKQDDDKEDDVAGPGFGFVNIFDSNGCLIRHFAARGRLNAPWGIALAPANFGVHSNQLLIANFGDGGINAFDLESGRFEGALRDRKGSKIKIDGLWGLAFGNGVLQQPTQTLFFTAGPNDETNGLYGKIEDAGRIH